MNPGPYRPTGTSLGNAYSMSPIRIQEGPETVEPMQDKTQQGRANSQATGGPDAVAVENRPAGDEPNSKLALELAEFTKVASKLRASLVPAQDFAQRCQQAFDVANDLFTNAPTWVCFYRELMGGSGLVHVLFGNNKDFGAFLRTEQYTQVQHMLTALRSRDLPENDPNDPQRMITVRLPKSLHEAMCEEAGRLNISVNRLCISRMLQLLDPEMIPEANSKPRGRKPRTRTKAVSSSALTTPVSQTTHPPQSMQSTHFGRMG